MVPDLLGPGQSTSLLSAGGGGMSFFAASAQPISSDLPCWRLISWKVGAFSWGPSIPEADFQEGRRFFMGTFHARSHFHGRSAHFHGDLPCQRPFLRKVDAFSWGPSMLEADFMEGQSLFKGAFYARGDTLERARGERVKRAGWR